MRLNRRSVAIATAISRQVRVADRAGDVVGAAGRRKVEPRVDRDVEALAEHRLLGQQPVPPEHRDAGDADPVASSGVRPHTASTTRRASTWAATS